MVASFMLDGRRSGCGPRPPPEGRRAFRRSSLITSRPNCLWCALTGAARARKADHDHHRRVPVQARPVLPVSRARTAAHFGMSGGRGRAEVAPGHASTSPAQGIRRTATPLNRVSTMMGSRRTSGMRDRLGAAVYNSRRSPETAIRNRLVRECPCDLNQGHLDPSGAGPLPST
jgi:hypothetical protein